MVILEKKNCLVVYDYDASSSILDIVSSRAPMSGYFIIDLMEDSYEHLDTSL